jgi:hypothetical protein
VLKGFIPDRASFSQEILAFSWLLQETMSDRDFSENALFSKLFRLLCEITFGNLLSEEAIKKELFPDQETFKREEQRRFEILLAHWDVPIEDVELDQ